MLDIIIVNWNAGINLLKAVNAVLGSSFQDYTIYLIDNASTDDSIGLIPKNDKINIIKNTYNKGFSAACNQGIQVGSGEYILFLNPDTIINKETLYMSISYLSSHLDVTILGCKQLNVSGKINKSCTRFPTFMTAFTDVIGLSKVFPNYFQPSTMMKDWDHRESRYVDQVMGSYFLLRRSTIQKVGMFDERFFVYYEDLDLSKRVIDAGGKVFYNAEIVIYHEGFGTTNQIKGTRLFYSISSRFKYYRKYFKFYQYLILKVMTFLAEYPLRVANCIFVLDLKGVIETTQAYCLLVNSKCKKNRSKK